MTADLITFLRARLDEDGERAESLHDLGCGVIRYDGTCDCGWPPQALAEVDAKRRIIDLHDELDREYQRDRYDESTSGQLSGVRFAVRFLALPYCDHPDYRPEWAPDA